MSLPPQQPGQPVNPEYGRQTDPQQHPPGGGQPQQPSPWTPEAQNGGPQQAWDPAAQQQWDAQQQWMAQQQAQQGAPQPGAQSPAGPPQPISMSFGGGAGLVKGTGIGCLIVAALCIPQTVTGALTGGGDLSWITFAVIAVALVLFGITCLRAVHNIRGAGLAIGPDGIQATLQGKTVRIAWHEIAYVGISITSSGFDGPGAPPVPSRYRGRSIIRIRLAGTTPGFADRPDMKFLVTHDEQEPYTHKLPIAKAGALGDARFGVIDPVARALAGFGGPRFTGVEQKRVAVGRYS